MKMVGTLLQKMKMLFNLKCGVFSVLIRKVVPVLCALLIALSSLAVSAPEASAAQVSISDLGHSVVGNSHFFTANSSQLSYGYVDSSQNRAYIYERNNKYGLGFSVSATASDYGVHQNVIFTSKDFEYFYWNFTFSAPYELVADSGYLDYVIPNSASLVLTLYDANNSAIGGYTFPLTLRNGEYFSDNISIRSYLTSKVAYFKLAVLYRYTLVYNSDYYVRPSWFTFEFIDVPSSSPSKILRIWDESGSRVLNTFYSYDSIFNNAPNIALYLDSSGFTYGENYYNCSGDRDFDGLVGCNGTDPSIYYSPGATVIASAAVTDLRITTREKEVTLSILDHIKNFGKYLASLFDISGAITSVKTSLSNFFSETKNFFAGIPGWFNSVIVSIGNLPDKIGEFFTTLGEDLKDLFKTPAWIISLRDSISFDFITEPFNYFKDFLADVRSFFSDTFAAFGRHSFFEYLLGADEDNDGGIWGWMNDNDFSQGVRSFFSFLSSVMASLPDPFIYLFNFSFGLTICFFVLKSFR